MVSAAPNKKVSVNKFKEPASTKLVTVILPHPGVVITCGEVAATRTLTNNSNTLVDLKATLPAAPPVCVTIPPDPAVLTVPEGDTVTLFLPVETEEPYEILPN